MADLAEVRTNDRGALGFVVSCDGCRRVLNGSCPDCEGPLELISSEMAVCERKTWPALRPPALQVSVETVLSCAEKWATGWSDVVGRLVWRRYDPQPIGRNSVDHVQVDEPMTQDEADFIVAMRAVPDQLAPDQPRPLRPKSVDEQENPCQG